MILTLQSRLGKANGLDTKIIRVDTLSDSHCLLAACQNRTYFLQPRG